MKLKRIAVVGLLTLSIVIGLCLFLSGTIKTIVTPKVQFVTVKSGVLTDRFSLPCALVYREAEELRHEVPEGMVIGQCFVQTGDAVKAGEPLFSLRLQDEQSREAQLMEAYHTALIEEAAFLREHASDNPTADEEAYYVAHEAWEQSVIQEGDARLIMEKLLPPGIDLPDEGYPEEADEALIHAIDSYRASHAARIAAENVLNGIPADEVRDDILRFFADKQEMERRVQSAKEALLAFQMAQDTVKTITAPHDGSIAEVCVRVGDAYDGTTPLCFLTGENGGPVLEADASSMPRSMTDGAEITVQTEWGDFSSKLLTTGMTRDGRLCYDVAIPQEITERGISLRRLADSAITISATIRSGEAHALVPVSAIHGVGKHRYVYVVEESTSALGGTEWSVREYAITVLAEADGYASVEEPLNRVRLAYMEDKELSDGCTVIGGAE